MYVNNVVDNIEMPFEIKVDDLSDDGTFKGYASTFGGEADSFGDIVVKGAFLDSIASNGYKGRGIKMLWQHDYKQPIGKWIRIEENNRGLAVVGKFTRGVKQADEAYLLMKDGAIDGLSIGFNVDKDGYEIDDKRKTRYLKKINLMEISPVTFGSNLKARITNVKSFVREAKTVRELERALRDSGLSNNDSLYLISLIKKDGLGQAENDHINDPILNTLKKVNAELTAFKYIEGVLHGR